MLADRPTAQGRNANRDSRPGGRSCPDVVTQKTAVRRLRTHVGRECWNDRGLVGDTCFADATRAHAVGLVEEG